MNPTARRNARRYAVQAMYQWQIADTAPTEIAAQFTKYFPMQNVDLEYFHELVQAIPAQQAELDAYMHEFLNRSMSDLDPVELAILRLAIYELAKRLDIPYRVVINEALELAKTFGSIEGYKFVNGILDQVARKLRTVEINAKTKVK